jgi:hypothetical protein
MPQQIKVVDEATGAPALLEVGHCGRAKCPHRHIAQDRFNDIVSGIQAAATAPSLGINVDTGRGMTRNPRFGTRDAQEALFKAAGTDSQPNWPVSGSLKPPKK